jgi:hypothetical protein
MIRKKVSLSGDATAIAAGMKNGQVGLTAPSEEIGPGPEPYAGSAVNLRKRDWQLLRRVAEARSDEKGGRRSVSKVIEGLIDAHRSTLEAEAIR